VTRASPVSAASQTPFNLADFTSSASNQRRKRFWWSISENERGRVEHDS
jgi:hypothetical protein